MILMSMLVLLSFALSGFLQGDSLPLLQGDVLTAAEKARLSRAQKVEDRIKVYESASKRMQQSIGAAARNLDFSNVSNTLKLWGALLSGSLQDIEANLKVKKKPKPLIRYEIQVRKAIADFKGYKTKAPVEQQDAIDEQLTLAENIRNRFVEIIFR